MSAVPSALTTFEGELVGVKTFISIDMEGVAGVATFDQVVRGGYGYPRAQELMTLEANAAISGAFDGGADEVVINDSHGTMDNLIHELLDPRAIVVFGSPKAQCMAEGLTADCDVALFLGYHAPAGEYGVLAHTFSSHFTEVRVNGAVVSEAEVNALYATSLGVPVGLVSGDDVICRIAREQFAGVEVVEVKVAHGYTSAASVAPSVARDAIREAAARVVRNAATLTVPELPKQFTVAVDMPTASAAELAMSIPGARRTSDRSVECTVRDPGQVLGLIVVFYELAASAMYAKTALFLRR